MAVYDLSKYASGDDVYKASNWTHAWNYVLPETTKQVVPYGALGDPGTFKGYYKNYYNDIDLASGDANNDGNVDLVISYGSSSTSPDNSTRMDIDKIYRARVSESVILYGSNDGQMLRKKQVLDYGDDLIRVSVAFGDLDDDENEDMILAGQKYSEKGANKTRMLEHFIYDGEKMVADLTQNMEVVADGNGWDKTYSSSLLMKTNLAVGKFMGQGSTTRIYLDSVLYSYDRKFQIEDELDDISDETTVDKEGKVTTRKKGSTIFNGLPDYVEYGAKSGNFTGGYSDYLVVHRIGAKQNFDVDNQMRYEANIVYAEKDSATGEYKLDADDSCYGSYKAVNGGLPYYYSTLDCDIDSTVAEYTGEHKIQYQNPKVYAVMASAPYFQDVADYDEGDILNWCSTSYGQNKSSSNGENGSFDLQLGIAINWQRGDGELTPAYYGSLAAGAFYSSEWEEETTKSYSISYDTAGGEDAVVLYSVPSENFKYKMTGQYEDENGNLQEYEQYMTIANPHKPVTQTLTKENYMEIQKEYSNALPDVDKYLTSEPGDPASYPSSETDLSKSAKEKLVSKETTDEWAGISYGSGSVSQTIALDKSESSSISGGLWLDTQHTGGFDALNGGGAGSLTLGQGTITSNSEGAEYGGTVANMPQSVKDYGYDFSWKLFAYSIKDGNTTFPIVTYMTQDVQSPAQLPRDIEQDYDNTTDSQIALSWTYNGNVTAFDVYKYADFPQGEGDELIGSLKASDYSVDTDADGKMVRRYTFLDKGLTADAKYQYRIKVRRKAYPTESIFSPIIEARTNVSEMPQVSISSEDLAIYPDGQYILKTKIKDADTYETPINYQWQKFNTESRTWEKLSGRTQENLYFYNCNREDEGRYRCRINLIRKKESNPQYISVYTDACQVDFNKREVSFGSIEVDQDIIDGKTATSISTSVEAATPDLTTERPTGEVTFTMTGSDKVYKFYADIDQQTGRAEVENIEKLMGVMNAREMRDGGYVITVRYEGSRIFKATDDPETCHYLRNVSDAVFFQSESSYTFGENIMETANLYEFSKNADGSVERKDLTDQISQVRIWAADAQGKKQGSQPVSTGNKDETILPMNDQLSKRAYVEIVKNNESAPCASGIINTVKRDASLSLETKTTGTGSALELYTADDVIMSGGGSYDSQNMIVAGQARSLADMFDLEYRYASGQVVAEEDLASMPAGAFTIGLKEKNAAYKTFYNDITVGTADFYVAGTLYYVSANCLDPNSGRVQLLSPDVMINPVDAGYMGGTRLDLKVLPNKGYQVKRWIIKEPGYQSVINTSDENYVYTVKNDAVVSANNPTIQITVELEPKNNTLTYQVLPEGSGTIQMEESTIKSGAVVTADTPLEFLATPADGWKFKEWRWINIGEKSQVSTGEIAEDGSSSKTYTMGDYPAELYAVFTKQTIDLDLGDNLEAYYVNDGSNPQEETGAKIRTEDGKDVPIGSTVQIRTKAGYQLPSGSDWKVMITTSTGTYSAKVSPESTASGDACRFELPEDVIKCSVSAPTERGYYNITLNGSGVNYSVKINGKSASGDQLRGVVSGSTVEVTATAERGNKLNKWFLDNEEYGSAEIPYTGSLTEPLNLRASTVSDDSLNLIMSADGGGSADYVITDKNGDTIRGIVTESRKTVEAYVGEKLQIRTSTESKLFTLKAVTVNGVAQPMEEDGSCILEDLEENSTILCQFMPNTYHHATFHSKTRTVSHLEVLDENGLPIQLEQQFSAATGRDLVFQVAYPTDSTRSSYVYANGVEYGAENASFDADQWIFTFRIPKVEADLDIYIQDYRTHYISDIEDLQQFFQSLSPNLGKGDAILTDDIDLENQTEELGGCFYNGIFDGTLDGQGHTIRGFSMDAYNYQGLFQEIGSNSVIKDLVLDGLSIRTGSDRAGLLADRNYGTISNVTIRNSKLQSTEGKSRVKLAGVAVFNGGKIQNTQVSNLTFISNHPNGQDIYAGITHQNTFDGHDGVIDGCYVEKLHIMNSDGSTSPATGLQIGPSNSGTITNSYYKLDDASRATDMEGGTSVWTLATSPDDTEKTKAEIQSSDWVHKLAYIMNQNAKSDVWGMTSAESTEIIQLVNGGKVVKAPVCATYQLEDKVVKCYYYPGMNQLADASVLDGAVPWLWASGNYGYSPGSRIDISSDTVFNGSYVTNLYKGSLTANSQTVYYKDAEEMLRDYQSYDAGKMVVTILGETSIQQDLTIREGDELKLLAKVTLNKGVSINNYGDLVIKSLGYFHKYGSIYNSGTLTVEGKFVNYGSRLINKGTIKYRSRIECKPHYTGEWHYADAPNEDGTWTQTSECEVCGDKESKIVQAMPIHILEDDGDDISELELGKGKTRDLTASLEGEVPELAGFKWDSVDPSIAEVDEKDTAATQTILAGEAGQTTITITAVDSKGRMIPGSVPRQIVVTVVGKAKKLSLSETALTVEKDDYYTLAARVEPASASGMVHWRVSDPDVCGLWVEDAEHGRMLLEDEWDTELSADGSQQSDAYLMIKGVSKGSTTLTASIETEDGGVLTATCQVNITDPAADDVKLLHNGSTVSGRLMTRNLDEGGIALQTRSNVSEDRQVWTTLDDTQDPVLEITEDGKINFLRNGVAAVRVSYENCGTSDVVMINVKTDATDIDLSAEQASLAIGQKHTLIATMKPIGSSGAITWTSSKPSVASVEKGQITAKATGVATITATVNGYSASCKVTVFDPNPDTRKNAAQVDQMIRAQSGHKDLSGSAYAPLKLSYKASKSGKGKAALTWKSVKGAKSYVIYGNLCGKKYKKLATTTKTTYTAKKLKKGRYYKFVVVAVAADKKVESISKLAHVAVKGGKATNPKAVKIKSLSTVKAKLAGLKVGRSYTVKASQSKYKGKLTKHRSIRYESSNRKVATVSSSGKVLAKTKGTCYIYIYTQSGVSKSLRVVVK